MEKKDLRIVYLGTPDFAVEALRALVEGGYNVVGVVTMPDKAVGRHHNQLRPSPVKQYALQQGLPILQPEKLKDEQFLEQLRSWQADLQIVVAFRMLPEAVWAMPRLGTFNIHASLLPQYRGAAPINWAIINGDKESGLTTFFLRHDIDTGDVIDRQRVPIGEDCTFGELHDRLMALSGELAKKTVDSILQGTVSSTPQAELTTDEPLRPAPKIFKETCRIDLTKSLDEIYNFVRGLSPAPGAWTMLRTHDAEQNAERVCSDENDAARPAKGHAEQELKIFAAQKIAQAHDHKVGTLLAGRKTLDIAVRGGLLRITELQLAGKKRMPTAAFLCGFKSSGNEMVV